MKQADTAQAMRLALEHHQAGRIAEAEKIYRQVLTKEPRQADALHLLGVIAHQSGKLDEAIQLIQQAIAARPNAAEFHNNLASVLRDKRLPDEALSELRQAVRLKPDYAEAHYNLGVALAENYLLDEAITAYRQTIRLKPNFAEAHNNLGNALRRKGLFDEAIAACQEATRIRPNYAEAYLNLGNSLRGKGSLDESIAALREAARLSPKAANIHHDLGNVLREKGFAEKAIAALRLATQLNPDFAEAYNNLGNALRDRNMLEEAIAAYHRALQLMPDSAEAHHNLSVAVLLKGDLKRGWPEYEWRWLCKGFASPRREFAQPRWDGSDLNGRTILLHAEQGFGDTIQFVRYAPMVASRGGKVVLQCQTPLRRLLRGFPGVQQFIAGNEMLPPFDVHCPLLSLPMVFGTTLETIPAKIPYLFADSALSQEWAGRLSAADKFRVGIVWAGAAGNTNDRNRSLTLSLLKPLANISGVSWVSLQKGEAAQQAANPSPGMELIDYTSELNDFADTAALISNLDLVITADTAAAHLAGAMGKPVWMLIPYAPDWRWLLERDDSPWYPTMRLFRQKKAADWGDVVERVGHALHERLSTFQPRSRPELPPR